MDELKSLQFFSKRFGILNCRRLGTVLEFYSITTDIDYLLHRTLRNDLCLALVLPYNILPLIKTNLVTVGLFPDCVHVCRKGQNLNFYL